MVWGLMRYAAYMADAMLVSTHGSCMFQASITCCAMAMLYQPVCHGVLCAVRRAGAKDQGVAGRCCCCGKEGSEAQAGDQEGLREVTDVRTHAYGSFCSPSCASCSATCGKGHPYYCTPDLGICGVMSEGLTHFYVFKCTVMSSSLLAYGRCRLSVVPICILV